MRYLPISSLRKQKNPRRTPLVFRPCVVMLIIVTILMLTAVPQAHAATLSTQTAHRPQKLTPAQIEAAHKALQQQIHVTHHATVNGTHPSSNAQTPATLRPQTAGLPAYNNVGISDATNHTAASIDGAYRSYSAQALQDAGIFPGINVTSQNITFIWPNVPSGQADNYQAAGQVIPVSALPGAATVGFLGASTNGNSSGTATLTYTDGTTSTFTLGFTDWWNGSAQFSNQQVAHLTTINTKHGTRTGDYYLYSVTTALNTSKTLQSVTLPTTTTPGQLHVFAVGVGGPAFNNIGITDNSSHGSGNIDGNGNSYSAQSLQSADLVPNKQFNLDGVAYTWPSASSGAVDNYQASGQILPVLPVPNATTLGFLGTASNGPSGGTATITYTDSTTQTFTLGFNDWWGGTQYSNQVAATFSVVNQSGGGQHSGTFYLYSTEVVLQSGKTIQSVTLPSSINQGQLHVFAIGTRSTLNNLAFSNDSQPGSGDMDNGHSSYSIQALEAAGITPGKPFSYDGTNFTIPASYGSLADNNLVNGQVMPVTSVSNATMLIVLGAADYANESGTATITYTDNSTQTFSLSLSDWQLGGNIQPVAFGNGIAVTTGYINNPSGKANIKGYIFSTEVALLPAETVQSVTLPTSLSPTNGQMHVFAISTRSQYNNTGISDNSNPAGANFDGVGASYSEQDFTDPTVAGWNPGDTLTYEGINYVWPGVPAGQADNYIAQGQTIPVSASAGATTIGFVGAADYAFPTLSGTSTLTYTDGSTTTFTLGFTDWSLDNGSATSVLASNRLFAILPHYNTPQGTYDGTHYLFEMETPLNPSKQLQSITLPSAASQGRLHVFMIGTRTGENYPNNVGTSDDADGLFANYDGNGNSYSIEALAADDINAGQALTFNSVNFTWPTSYSVIPDNYRAAGQTIPITPVANATILAFLGSATNGPSQGTATITYTDSTTQTFNLGFTDWASNTISYGNTLVTTTPYVNTASGQANSNHYLYYAQTSLQAGKTIQSVTLPTTVNQGQLHVFAVGTRATSPYNNAGISDDTNRLGGNYDGSPAPGSWSAQALQQVGITPGANLTYNGVTFTWPNVPSGQFDNYQANGQVIPVTPVANATTLAFLGSATYGPSQGTAIITYTDSSTQTFSLGFTDWGTSTISYSNVAVATTPYVNIPSGQVNGTHYLYTTQVSLQAGKTIQSVTLPTTVNQGAIHVFAIGTK